MRPLAEIISAIWRIGNKMPVVNRTLGKGMRPTPDGTTGSVLSEAMPIDRMPPAKIKMLLYGENRVGKTSLACQFPKPLLLISLEAGETGGAGSVRNVAGVSYLRLRESARVVTLASELRGSNPFVTVVLDGATALQDIVLKEILNLPAIPELLRWGMVSRDQYRERSEKTREVLRPFLDLSCHLIIVAKQQDHNQADETGSSPLFGVGLGKSTAEWLQDGCDNVCQLYMDMETVQKVRKVGKIEVMTEEKTGKRVRRLRCVRHPNYYAGMRSCTPEKVPEYIEDPTYDKIAAVINGD